MKKEVKISYSKTEWLYAHGFKYITGENVEREIGLIFPYQRQWDGDERFPLVVYIPGAAWHRQELYNDVPKFVKLAERGCVFVILQVRESELAKFPAQMEDVHRGIDWILKSADRFHIDSNRIYLAGNSSGGHLALMAAFSKAHGKFVPGDVTEYQLAGVIGQAAASDIQMCLEGEWIDTSNRPTEDLLGAKMGDEEFIEKAQIATCKNYVDKDVALPPVLLLHFSEDPIVDCQMTRDLYDKLIENGHRADYVELLGEEHGGNGFWNKEVLDIIEEFITGNH